MTFWAKMMTCEAEALLMEHEAHTLRPGFQFHPAQNDGFQGIITDKTGVPEPHFSTSTNAKGSMPREAGCNNIAPWASAPQKGLHIIARGKRNAVERHPGLRCVALSGRNHAAYIETINHD